jgi:hypothetical protein
MAIQKWCLTGGTNEVDNTDPIIQTGWSHILKGKVTYHTS